MAVASSLSRWGRFLAFSSWRMVATTTSSFIPSVSTLMAGGCEAAPDGGGEGGGVWAARLGRGRAGLAGEAAAGSDAAGTASLCDRFIFLEGGGRESGDDVAVVAALGEDGFGGAGALAPALDAAVGLELARDGGGRWAEGRGTWMPSRLRFTLLRRVLYAMGGEGEERRSRGSENEQREGMGSRSWAVWS
jgi:hypothetical protein